MALDQKMLRAGRIIEAARARGQRTLSEYDSKRVLAAYGIPAEYYPDFQSV